MKIRMTLVGPELAAEMQSEVDALRRAVDMGDMDAVDAATARLLNMTGDCDSIVVSEQAWRTFTNEIRSKNPGFESNYLLPAAVCAGLFPSIKAGEQVLELPIDDETDEDQNDV